MIPRCQIASGVRSPREKKSSKQENEDNDEKTFLTEVQVHIMIFFVFI